jgi:hypothetical protein
MYPGLPLGSDFWTKNGVPTSCGSHLALKMVGDHLFQAGVESLAVLVQNHRVRIAIQLLKAQPRVVLPLDLLGKKFYVNEPFPS